jgi:hypothetical protein
MGLLRRWHNQLQWHDCPIVVDVVYGFAATRASIEFGSLYALNFFADVKDVDRSLLKYH